MQVQIHNLSVRNFVTSTVTSALNIRSKQFIYINAKKMSGCYRAVVCGREE